ncbi:MAG: methionine biosynthesis protein MetW [Gammaproteobacteria bacterium]|nr:methionine biosynthesis protein MetW [Gammaproteobacteria bacterium]|tara:strand:- start:78596 stop:79189 length:594 start_codon:yes stop_codon:yes gene_type:complete
MAFRKDLLLISSWIKPNTTVLDLGCGDGELIKILIQEHSIHGYGVEIDLENIKKSIKNKINVLQMDIDSGLSEFDSNSFDYVVLAQSLQVVKNPKNLIDEMRRVGKEIIVSFPNMGHWSSRLNLLLQGKMPVTKNLPHSWYKTPNIHLCTIKDFLIFCKDNNYNIIETSITNNQQKSNMMVKIFPNLFGAVATFRIN